MDETVGVKVVLRHQVLWVVLCQNLTASNDDRMRDVCAPERAKATSTAAGEVKGQPSERFACGVELPLYRKLATPK